MIEIWLKGNCYVVVLYFGVVEEYAVCSAWNRILLVLFTLVSHLCSLLFLVLYRWINVLNLHVITKF
jgi:hypothetical protein